MNALSDLKSTAPGSRGYGWGIAALATIALGLGLACGGGGGGGGSTPPADPTITSFTVADSTITFGATTQLTALFANGTGQVDNGIGDVTSGTPKDAKPEETTVYTLSVINSALVEVTDTVTVTVVPATPVITIPGNPPTLTATQEFTASVDPQTRSTYAWTLGGDYALVPGEVTTNSSITFIAGAIGNSVTLNCTVTNAAGVMAFADQKQYNIVAAGNNNLTVTITDHFLVPADVETTFPGHANLTASAVIDCTAVANGSYTITAQDVPVGAITHYPYQRTWTVNVTGGVPSVNALTVLYPEPTLTVDIPVAGSNPAETTPMVFVLVPPGSFQMGADPNTYDSNYLDATPKHPVTIPHAFYVAQTECTQGQYQAVTGNNPSWFTVSRGGANTDDPTRPVDYVTWHHAKAYLIQLNTALPGYAFRLPSEAEWEYAVRANTTTDYFFGNTPLNLSTYAWWNKPSPDPSAVPVVQGGPINPVGLLESNPWRLKDVLGNVWEWCEDDAHGDYHLVGENPPTNGSGYAGAPADGRAWVDSPERDLNRILRGGGYRGDDDLSPRSAFRWAMAAGDNQANGYRDSSIGFRLVMPVPLLP